MLVKQLTKITEFVFIVKRFSNKKKKKKMNEKIMENIMEKIQIIIHVKFLFYLSSLFFSLI